MKFITTIIFLLICFVFVINGDIWSSCGKDGDKLTIKSVVLTPPQPIKGQPLTIQASGILSETITGGSIRIIVKLGIIPIFNKNEDLCNPESPIKCPIPEGELNHEITVTVPAEAPSGEYKANAILTDQNNEEIACINVDLKL